MGFVPIVLRMTVKLGSVPSWKGSRGLRSLAEWPSLPAHRDLTRLSMVWNRLI